VSSLVRAGGLCLCSRDFNRLKILVVLMTSLSKVLLIHECPSNQTDKSSKLLKSNNASLKSSSTDSGKLEMRPLLSWDNSPKRRDKRRRTRLTASCCLPSSCPSSHPSSRPSSRPSSCPSSLASRYTLVSSNRSPSIASTSRRLKSVNL